MKYVVVFFSASGKTKKLGELMSEKIKCDSYEIKPCVKYSSEDLDWTNSKSRSSLEMKDKTSRPKIINDGFDFSKYDCILLGFPIWWYTAPTIINSFLETYKIKNNKIILWATSGGSGLGSAKLDLAKSTHSLIVDGRVINNSSALEKFINELE